MINGCEPVLRKKYNYHFNHHYRSLDHPVKFTGSFLLATRFMEKLYVHMGFHPYWKYERVIELTFKKGVLVSEADWTEKAAEERSMQLGGEPVETLQVDPLEKLFGFVEGPFDRSCKHRSARSCKSRCLNLISRLVYKVAEFLVNIGRLFVKPDRQ